MNINGNCTAKMKKEKHNNFHFKEVNIKQKLDAKFAKSQKKLDNSNQNRNIEKGVQIYQNKNSLEKLEAGLDTKVSKEKNLTTQDLQQQLTMNQNELSKNSIDGKQKNFALPSNSIHSIQSLYLINSDQIKHSFNSLKQIINHKASLPVHHNGDHGIIKGLNECNKSSQNQHKEEIAGKTLLEFPKHYNLSNSSSKELLKNDQGKQINCNRNAKPINHKELADFVKKNRSVGNNFDIFLINQEKFIEEKSELIEAKKKDIMKKEKSECIFKPHINKNIIIS